MHTMLHNPDGTTTRAVRHPTLKAFRKSVESMRRASQPPERNGLAPAVAYGQDFQGSEFHMHHGAMSGKSVVHVYGRQLLGILKTSDVTGVGSLAGQYFSEGVHVLSPFGLGGMSDVLSELYEQCDFEHMRVMYVPNDPTNVGGGVFLSFADDVGARTDVVGQRNLNHLAQRKYFRSTPVWAGIDLEISPDPARHN